MARRNVQQGSSIGLPTTAFGDIRVALPFSLADLIQTYGVNPEDYGTLLVGAGTVTDNLNQSGVDLNVTGGATDESHLRSHSNFRYQAGKGTRVIQTVRHSNADTHQDQIRRWGLFDDENGLYWKFENGEMAVVRRTSTSGAPVETVVTQANWNVDRFDGTGPSRATLDITKQNLYFIDFQWLGAGTVEFYVASEEGHEILVHRMQHAGLLDAPYMGTPVLPVHLSIVNTGVGVGPATMTSICNHYKSEGGEGPPPNISFGAYNATPAAMGAAEVDIVSVRLKSTFNTRPNKMIVVPHIMAINTDGRVVTRLIKNATLTAPVWVSADANSGVEFDVSGSGFAGGQHITLLQSAINSTVTTDTNNLFDPSGRTMRQRAFGAGSDILTIVGSRITGNPSVVASISWTEER